MRIICKLPNASELISGVKFASHKLGMISEEIADDVAAAFLSIPGYVVADKRGRPVEDEAAPAPAEAPATEAAPAAPAAAS